MMMGLHDCPHLGHVPNVPNAESLLARAWGNQMVMTPQHADRPVSFGLRVSVDVLCAVCAIRGPRSIVRHLTLST